MNKQNLASTLHYIRNSVVQVHGYRDGAISSIGTGFLVHIEGYIVTAFHVIEDCDRIEVLPDNWRQPITAKRIRKNRDDLAILQIDYKALDENFKVRFSPAKVLARTEHIVAGADVGVAGYAWGMSNADDSTLFVFRRTVALNIMHPAHSRGLFYYLDGTAIAGMSGGPVFIVETGEIAGIVVRIQPEDIVEVNTLDGTRSISSAEHLTVTLQSFYIHTGLESLDIYL